MIRRSYFISLYMIRCHLSVCLGGTNSLALLLRM